MSASPRLSQVFAPDKVIVHHSASRGDLAAAWGVIRDHHVQTEKWLAIGYHLGVGLVGLHYEVLMGRDWDLHGAHTLGQNDKALGICFIGNYEDQAPRPGMLIAGAKAIAYWCRVFGIPASEIYPHSHFNATACPGKFFPLEDLRSLVEAAL